MAAKTINPITQSYAHTQNDLFVTHNQNNHQTPPHPTSPRPKLPRPIQPPNPHKQNPPFTLTTQNSQNKNQETQVTAEDQSTLTWNHFTGYPRNHTYATTQTYHHDLKRHGHKNRHQHNTVHKTWRHNNSWKIKTRNGSNITIYIYIYYLFNCCITTIKDPT